MRMFVVDKASGYRVVTLAGELDLEAARDVREALVEVVRHAERVDVDLARIFYIDSAGINALVAARKAATCKGCAFVVVNPSPRTRRLLGITGLLDVLTAPPHATTDQRPHPDEVALLPRHPDA